MRKNSFLDGIKNLGKQLLYTEAENTNTDRETIVEVDSNGNKKYVTRAGAGPETHNNINDNNLK